MSKIKTEQFAGLIRRQISLMSHILQTKDSSLLLTPCEEEYFVANTHQICVTGEQMLKQLRSFVVKA